MKKQLMNHMTNKLQYHNVLAPKKQNKITWKVKKHKQDEGLSNFH